MPQDYEKLMDRRQKDVHTHFPSSHYLSNPEHVARLMDWATFYIRNRGRFAQHYLNLTLHLYQHFILYLMSYFPSVCIIAARSAAKSFIIAIFAVSEAILKPNSRIVIASATKKQARLIVSEKIKKEILPGAPLLEAEIASIKDGQSEIEITFHNGSSIVVVAALDSSRGYRATVLIYEEFRMIKKHIIDTVLSPFLVTRSVNCYTEYPEYESLIEEPQEIYISSAWYRNHWMWGLIKNLTRDMIYKRNSIVLAMDYSVTLMHKIKTRDYLLKERRKLDPVSWSIEYENQMIAENAKAYFTYEMLEKNQVLKRPFYPRREIDIINGVKNRFPFPKQAGELRIISCDIAAEAGERNDNSIYSCIRLMPESKEYKVSDTSGESIQIKRGYRRQLVHMEPHNGAETSEQAIRIKQLFYDFDADYCVLDGRSMGVSIYDSLAKVLYDENRNREYPPWTCMNEKSWADRLVIAGQVPVVFVIKATAELNSKIAVSMRTALEAKMFDLLINQTEGIEEIQRVVPGYGTAEIEEQIYYEMPYMETSALINEMINLEYTVMSQTGIIRIEERPGARKDRYTSVSYGNYFVDLLEKDLLSNTEEYEYVALFN